MFLTFLDAELLRLELLYSNKVPDFETQQGGAMKTRRMKREADQGDNKSDVKVAKPEADEPVADTTDEYGGGPDPIYVADFKKLGPAKRWKKNAVVNQKFIMTLDKKRGPKPDEYLNIGATLAINVATDNLTEELKIPNDYQMTLQIGSREHMKEGLTGDTWKVNDGDFTENYPVC